MGTAQAGRLTELDDDLAKVVWVAREGKEALVAHGLGVVGLAEAVLLHVAQGLEGEEDEAGDVAGGVEGVLRVARDVGRVEQGDGQGEDPEQEHLEDPEAEEGPEAVALVVEAVVGAGAQDAEEEEAGEADGPDDEQERGDELAREAAARQGERQDGEQGEVGAAGEVWSAPGEGGVSGARTVPAGNDSAGERGGIPVSLSNLRAKAMAKKKSW